jgi:ethanolaminephosphotransferase
MAPNAETEPLAPSSETVSTTTCFTSGHVYISEEALENLKYYKYASIDKSLISKYILRPYWEWMTTLFPLWMAPNLITLCGLGFIIVNVILAIIYVPDLLGPGPSWLYFSFAAGIWFYSTFDNVDGKQARRTGTSSPLGELFDHGVDALNCSLGALIQAAGMGFGHTWYTVFLIALTTIPFYFSTWEEYHTGVLYLGYINGPTEGLLISCTILILSGVFGPQFWFRTLSDVFGSQMSDTLTLADLLVMGMTFLLVTTQLPASLYGVYVACQRKGTSFSTAIAQLFPMGVYLAATIGWILSPYSVLLERQHLIWFTITVGLVFGRMATKIILAHLTRMPFPWFTFMMLPLVVGSILVNAPYLGVTILSADGEVYYLAAFSLFALLAYGHWAWLVIDRFCKHLNIRCLSIPYEPSKEH